MIRIEKLIDIIRGKYKFVWTISLFLYSSRTNLENIFFLSFQNYFSMEKGDGGDGGNGMATPSSNTSKATTGALVATATQQGRVQRPTTVMTHKNRKIRVCTSDVWNDFKELFEVVNGKKTRYAA
jgi:hypothetical protein